MITKTIKIIKQCNKTWLQCDNADTLVEVVKRVGIIDGDRFQAAIARYGAVAGRIDIIDFRTFVGWVDESILWSNTIVNEYPMRRNIEWHHADMNEFHFLIEIDDTIAYLFDTSYSAYRVTCEDGRITSMRPVESKPDEPEKYFH